MEINTKKKDGVVDIKLKRKFNIEEVERFEKELSHYLNETTQTITIDFGKLDYIDSSALGSLIKSMNTAKNMGIEFILYEMSPSIYNIFHLAYLDRFFTITKKAELSKKFPSIKF
jgi:anti-sigma B factor antagonist